MHRASNVIDFLDRFPPFVVYALARDKRSRQKRLSFHRIAAASGLSQRTFFRIARLKSWSGVKVVQVAKFCEGCGVDIMRSKERYYLKRTISSNRPLSHLTASQLARFNQFCMEAAEAKKLTSGALGSQSPLD